MAFGSMMPMDTTIQPNQLMKQGMGILQQAQQRQGQQGLLQRLLNPQAPPTDLAAPGMPPNGGGGGSGGNPMQMGMLAKLFPALAGQQPPAMPTQQPAPVMPQGDPTGGLGGLY